MTTTPYRGFRFPKAIIQHAIWLYLRFTLSLRDVEELLAERGIVVTYETVRVWVARFGPLIARRLRRRRGRPSNVWHLDEMFVKIGGRQMYLWRAVDSEGEVLDMLVQSRRDKRAAAADAQAAEEPGRGTEGARDRPAAGLWRGGPRARARRRAHPGQAEEQPGGRLARPDPTARAEDAGLPLARLGPTLPRCTPPSPTPSPPAVT